MTTALLLLLLLVAPDDTFTGKVVAITDGDSLKVLHNRKEVTIRLEGIDSPELGQAFGRKAKKAASELAFGKTVTVRATGKDRYGRTLAEIILPNGTSLNEELVRTGYAWWFRKYSDDQKLKQFEAEARAKQRGLWSDAKPVAPWDWRAAQRAKSKVMPSDLKIVPNGVSILALLPNPKGRDAGNEKVLIGNSIHKEVDLSGWKLVDKAGNVYLLSGTVEAGKALVITMTDATMPLNNNGDIVALVDADGVGRNRVNYGESQAGSGEVVRFGE